MIIIVKSRLENLKFKGMIITVFLFISEMARCRGAKLSKKRDNYISMFQRAEH